MSVNININGKLAEAEHSERLEIAEVLQRLAGEIGSRTATVGTIISRNGDAVGSWSYSRSR